MEEEPMPEQELSLAETLQEYGDETPGVYTGGLAEDLGEDALTAEEV